MQHSLRFVWAFVIGVAFSGLAGCGSTRYNSDYNLNQARLKGGASADALAAGDTTRPSVETPDALASNETKTEKRKKKQDKRHFLGHKVRKGFVKTGGRGDRQNLETFSFLDEHQAPDPYAPAKHYYDTKKRRIVRASGEADPARYKVLHGPYKKKIGDLVVQEGYFYIGTKHLRWEYYRRDEQSTLVDKEHYEKGFPRDAVVTYYAGNDKKLKEVLPYEYGEVSGTYYRFYENGQVEWTGQYEKGRKVGVWIKHYDFRNRRHYEYQYPQTAYEAPAEPYLVKEYDRHGTLIYEKGKLDKRSQAYR